MKKLIEKNGLLILAMVFLGMSGISAGFEFKFNHAGLTSLYSNLDYFFLTVGAILCCFSTSVGLGRKVLYLSVTWIGALLITNYFLQ
ncbi:MAG: hypothetical protein JWM92_524 [Candidatus Nomurabacteria bacterium]|nr:hypothetical protein [Candidatus Nomurabacteria bacterium]